MNVTNSNGSVDLKALSPLGEVVVDNRTGEVNVELAGQDRFTVSAETDGGSVNNDFSLKVDDDGKALRAAAVNGGGALVSLRTTHADINLHKSEP